MPFNGDGKRVSQAEAVAAWAAAAREVLVDTATGFRAVITYGDLAEVIQDRTGYSTRQQLNYWIDDVLGAVSDAQPADEPSLTSLVVNAQKEVGVGYVAAVSRREGQALLLEDREQHAAEQRLACYHRFGAVVPEGAEPEVSPGLVEQRRAAAATAARAPQFCPTCFMQLSSTGRCPSCGTAD